MKSRRAGAGPLVVLCLIVIVGLFGCASRSMVHEHSQQPEGHSHDGEEPNALLEDAIATAGLLVTHIHGIGYSADGERIYLAAHDGLKVFQSGEWAAPALSHDFMGFTAVEGGFFSSGHPAANSGLPNPLGLVHVDESDWNLSMLGYQQELDFHLMAAGYYSQTVYLVNTQASSTLPTGLFVTNDRGDSWQRQPASGLAGTLGQIAVHPTDPLVSAYATSNGLYVSVDGGQSAELWIERGDGYAVAFSPDGQRIYFGGTDLEYRDLAGDGGSVGQAESVGTIWHIAINPQNPVELTITTSRMSVIRSVDAGATWQPILLEGSVP